MLSAAATRSAAPGSPAPSPELAGLELVPFALTSGADSAERSPAPASNAASPPELALTAAVRTARGALPAQALALRLQVIALLDSGDPHRTLEGLAAMEKESEQALSVLMDALPFLAYGHRQLQRGEAVVSLFRTAVLGEAEVGKEGVGGAEHLAQIFGWLSSQERVAIATGVSQARNSEEKAAKIAAMGPALKFLEQSDVNGFVDAAVAFEEDPHFATAACGLLAGHASLSEAQLDKIFESAALFDARAAALIAALASEQTPLTPSLFDRVADMALGIEDPNNRTRAIAGAADIARHVAPTPAQRPLMERTLGRLLDAAVAEDDGRALGALGGAQKHMATDDIKRLANASILLWQRGAGLDAMCGVAAGLAAVEPPPDRPDFVRQLFGRFEAEADKIEDFRTRSELLEQLGPALGHKTASQIRALLDQAARTGSVTILVRILGSFAIGAGRLGSEPSIQPRVLVGRLVDIAEQIAQQAADRAGPAIGVLGPAVKFMSRDQIERLAGAMRRLPDHAKLSALTGFVSGLADLAREDPDTALRAHDRLVHTALEIYDPKIESAALDAVIGALRDFPAHHIEKGISQTRDIVVERHGGEEEKRMTFAAIGNMLARLPDTSAELAQRQFEEAVTSFKKIGDPEQRRIAIASMTPALRRVTDLLLAQMRKDAEFGQPERALEAPGPA